MKSRSHLRSAPVSGRVSARPPRLRRRRASSALAEALRATPATGPPSAPLLRHRVAVFIPALHLLHYYTSDDFDIAVSDKGITIDWDWSSFACAIIGNTDCTPALNRSAHYHYRSVWLTLERLREEGHVRPAAILSRSVQDRIHSMQMAAFLTNHPTPKIATDSVKLCNPDEFPKLERWLRKLDPDALVLGWQVDHRTAGLLREFVPTARRMVTLEWQPQGALPRNDPLNEAIAANAVDLVIAQLHRKNTGSPPARLRCSSTASGARPG